MNGVIDGEYVIARPTGQIFQIHWSFPRAFHHSKAIKLFSLTGNTLWWSIFRGLGISTLKIYHQRDSQKVYSCSDLIVWATIHNFPTSDSSWTRTWDHKRDIIKQVKTGKLANIVFHLNKGRRHLAVWENFWRIVWDLAEIINHLCVLSLCQLIWESWCYRRTKLRAMVLNTVTNGLPGAWCCLFSVTIIWLL